jgi:glutamate-1-semialdehyde 2,1-aminomutase
MIRPSTIGSRQSQGSSHAAADAELDEYMHLYMVNRGVVMTPFHNMALMCPATTKADVDMHTAVFRLGGG